MLIERLEVTMEIVMIKRCADVLIEACYVDDIALKRLNADKEKTSLSF